VTESSVIASAVSPQGRNVELTEERWRYIQRHVEMRERQETLLEAIRRPDFQDSTALTIYLLIYILI
jgi:hypothetical protein